MSHFRPLHTSSLTSNPLASSCWVFLPNVWTITTRSTTLPTSDNGNQSLLHWSSSLQISSFPHTIWSRRGFPLPSPAWRHFGDLYQLLSTCALNISPFPASPWPLSLRELPFRLSDHQVRVNSLEVPVDTPLPNQQTFQLPAALADLPPTRPNRGLIPGLGH